MISFPNAKINLGLNVLEKRADGYHELASGFYPIPWHDSLEIIESKQFLFRSYGLPIPGDMNANLCLKAYELVKSDHNIPNVEIHLLKNIPMGAGLGGGSADGAFTLTLLNNLFDLGLSIEKLESYALKLGSDCPFFIKNEPAFATGRGELLESVELTLSGKYLAIHNPDLHISTKEAFSGLHPVFESTNVLKALIAPPSGWRNNLRNDFEESIFHNHPQIEKLRDQMYEAGAIYSSMTGTGSTVYGLFEEQPKNNAWRILQL